MWFKVENKRSSIGQRYVVRCNSEIAGSPVIEERPVKGPTAARKTAEILASSLSVTATVYGTDAEGEFVHGVYEVSDGAATAQSAVIKRLFAESAAASLSLKDQLLANIPDETIKGFAAMSAALGILRRPAQTDQTLKHAADQLFDAVSHLLRRGRTNHPHSAERRCHDRDLDAQFGGNARLDVAQ
jgi:hypothetical protein